MWSFAENVRERRTIQSLDNNFGIYKTGSNCFPADQQFTPTCLTHNLSGCSKRRFQITHFILKYSLVLQVVQKRDIPYAHNY